MFPTGYAAGDKYVFKIEAFNKQTSAESSVSAIILLASVPGTPSNAPGAVDDETNGNQVTVLFEPVTDDGGSLIFTYELQMGNGNKLNNFVTVSGIEPNSLSLTFTVTKGIVKGTYYAFRYRAVNSVGAGEWSPLARLQAGTIPPAPQAPTFIAASTSSVTLSLAEIADNGGSQITEVKIFMDSGNYTDDIDVLVSGYLGESQFEITGLTNDTVYRFAYVATNAFGDSEQSTPISVHTSSKPMQLDPPQVDRSLSSRTSLYVYWEAQTDPDAYILGYILSMDDGMGGAFTDIFDGQFQPEILSYTVTGLTTGLEYRFKVRAQGYNEQGDDSDIASYYACVPPTNFSNAIHSKL